MTDQYRISYIEDLVPGDTFIYEDEEYSLKDRFIPMGDYAEIFGVYGRLEYIAESGYTYTLHTYSNLPVVVLNPRKVYD